MKRFINNPGNAHREFSKYAFKIHPNNLAGSYQRGGIRLA